MINTNSSDRSSVELSTQRSNSPHKSEPRTESVHSDRQSTDSKGSQLKTNQPSRQSNDASSKKSSNASIKSGEISNAVDNVSKNHEDDDAAQSWHSSAKSDQLSVQSDVSLFRKKHSVSPVNQTSNGDHTGSIKSADSIKSGSIVSQSNATAKRPPSGRSVRSPTLSDKASVWSDQMSIQSKQQSVTDKSDQVSLKSGQKSDRASVKSDQVSLKSGPKPDGSDQVSLKSGQKSDQASIKSDQVSLKSGPKPDGSDQVSLKSGQKFDQASVKSDQVSLKSGQKFDQASVKSSLISLKSEHKSMEPESQSADTRIPGERETELEDGLEASEEGSDPIPCDEWDSDKLPQPSDGQNSLRPKSYDHSPDMSNERQDKDILSSSSKDIVDDGEFQGNAQEKGDVTHTADKSEQPPSRPVAEIKLRYPTHTSTDYWAPEI